MSDKVPPWAEDIFGQQQVARPQSDVWAMLRMQGNADNLYPALDIGNIAYVLDDDDRWRGRVKLNQFTDLPELDGEDLSDDDETSFALWLTRVYKMRNVNGAKVSEMIRYTAARHAYHPVRDYLNGLEWDGKPRAGALLDEYFAAQSDEESGNLTSVLSRCFLVSLVARVMVPGCKVDTTLVLRGKQGGKKSSGLQALAGEKWFSDTPIEIGHKDGYAAMNGVWLYEFAELDSFSRKESTAVKGFLSTQKDRYRPAYGRHARTFKRQTVTAGTTNKDDFLQDETGSRRFWPVSVGSPDVDAITGDRDQIWAEAVQLYNAGFKWWLDEAQTKLLVDASKDYEDSDPWELVLLDWAQGREGFTISELLKGALDIEVDKISRRESMRAGKVLARAGWVKKRKRDFKRRSMCWWPAPTEEGS